MFPVLHFDHTSTLYFRWEPTDWAGQSAGASDAGVTRGAFGGLSIGESRNDHPWCVLRVMPLHVVRRLLCFQ